MNVGTRACLQTHHGPAPLLDPALSESRVRATLQTRPSVRERYSRAAQDPEPALCCPVGYDPDLLRLLPEEILDRDYGCGDPTGYMRPGDTVLDLGSGSGKHCYIGSSSKQSDKIRPNQLID